MSGKGDKPRPVDKKKYDRNYELIFRNGGVLKFKCGSGRMKGSTTREANEKIEGLDKLVKLACCISGALRRQQIMDSAYIKSKLLGEDDFKICK